MKIPAHPSISVIIPTYNRKAWLRQTLDSLAQQTFSAERFEVIVVDDGSDDGTIEIAAESFPFLMRYIKQVNKGDAAARNTGAKKSRGDVLVFLDDDILIDKDFLTSLIPEHSSSDSRIIVGTEHLWLDETNPLDQIPPAVSNKAPELVKILFTEVCSNNMSIRRQAYFDIGMMQGLEFAGSSIWCDVDFSYRAFQKGFEFYRSTKAVCWHRDYVALNLDNRKKRMREVSYRAVRLFQKHPDLSTYLPMFNDMTPIVLGQDSPGLIVRKFSRSLLSSRPALLVLEKFNQLIGAKKMAAGLAQPLGKWITGGYIYRGYREGLRDLLAQPGRNDG